MLGSKSQPDQFKYSPTGRPRYLTASVPLGLQHQKGAVERPPGLFCLGLLLPGFDVLLRCPSLLPKPRNDDVQAVPL